MATHSSILAWRSPWTGEPGRLQSMGSQRVRHDCTTPFQGVVALTKVFHKQQSFFFFFFFDTTQRCCRQSLQPKQRRLKELKVTHVTAARLKSGLLGIFNKVSWLQNTWVSQVQSPSRSCSKPISLPLLSPRHCLVTQLKSRTILHPGLLSPHTYAQSSQPVSIFPKLLSPPLWFHLLQLE